MVVFLCFSARELELEDRQSRLQQELRERMAVDGNGDSLLLTIFKDIKTPVCVLNMKLSSCYACRPPEGGGAAGRGTSDPGGDVGGGGAEGCSGVSAGGATAKGVSGRPGP